MRSSSTPWRRARLGDYFRIKHGYAFKGEFFDRTGPYVVLTPGNFERDGGIKLKGEREKRYATEFPEEFLLHRGDLLVVMTDLTQNAPILGSPAFIPEDGKFLHNQRLGKVVDLNEAEMDRRFLYCLFNSPGVRSQIKASATGATVKHTAPERIYPVKVEVPPLPIQRRIVGILSPYDNLIENNTRRIRILEQMAQALYREWFVNFRFPGHEKVRLVASPLGKIPQRWEVRKLSDLVTVQKGKKPKSVSDVHENGFVPHLLLDAIEGGVQQCTSVENMVLAEPDDVVMVMDGARSGVVFNGLLGAIGSTLGRFRPADKATFSPLLLMLLLQDRKAEIQAKNVGAAIPHANKEYLRVMEVVLPPPGINREFHSLCEPLYALRRNLAARDANLRRTRDLLLPKLVEGQIDVTGLDIETAAITP